MRNGARPAAKHWVGENLAGFRRRAKSFCLRPVSLVSYNGIAHPETNDNHRGGCRNSTEAVIIVSMCRSWLSASDKFKNRIIVLSPYRAQVEAIKTGLRVGNIEGVEVGTVDSAQRREADVVIISLAKNRVGRTNVFSTTAIASTSCSPEHGNVLSSLGP